MKIDEITLNFNSHIFCVLIVSSVNHMLLLIGVSGGGRLCCLALGVDERSEHLHNQEYAAPDFYGDLRQVTKAANGGTWELLKNIHLAPQWFVQLEKKLHNLSPHPSASS
eukprot:Phypoly_transcript_26577.p1 GENE.Phypoly_transcript_26577~~Phypoly_transcript_26577.p1  ORF type:complete len:110 (+),score=14.03 Phypoly_transcript_26577:76-405(+)